MPESTTFRGTYTLERAFIDSGAAEQQPFRVFDVSGDSDSYRAASEFRAAEKQAFLSETTGNPIFNNCPAFLEDNQARRQIFRNVEAIGRRLALHFERGDDYSPGVAVLHDLVLMRSSEYKAVQNAAAIAHKDSHIDDSTTGFSSWSITRNHLAQTVKKELRTAYGMPDASRTAQLLAEHRQRAEAVFADREHPLRTEAAEILRRTQMPTVEYKLSQQLSREQIACYGGRFIAMTQPAIDYAFAPYGRQDQFSAIEMQDITTRYMQHAGYIEAGFSAELEAGRTTSLADIERRAVLIGQNRAGSQLSRIAIEKTIKHEVGGHIHRMVAGRRLGSELAGYALDRANSFEEAWITTLINMSYGRAPLSGDPSLLAIGLAAGYDGGGERDLRDSFEVQWRIALLKSYDSAKPLDEQKAAVRKATLAQQERIWRGMPTDVPGCIMPRDHAYDNSKILEYFWADGGVLDQEQFMRDFAARFDPRRPSHARYVDSLLG